MRTLVYALMTLSVVTIVTILILVILGYSFNRQDGKLEQGSLLQFASTPSGATVTIDGVRVGSRTPSKASVEARSHHVQMNLQGYRSWSKTIDVKAGDIGWLSYARLVPNDIQVDAMKTFPTVAASLATVDRKWIAVQEDAASQTLSLVNLESDTPKFTTLTIPSNILTAADSPTSGRYSFVAWNRDDNRILIKRTYDDTKVEWLVINRDNPQDSVNVTTSYGVNIADAQFGERNGNDLYVLSDDSIVRRIDLGSNTLSGVLAEGVVEFSIYKNNVLLYVTKPDGSELNQRHVGYRESGMTAPQTVFSYPAETENLHLAFGEYYGKRYVGVTHDTTMQTFVGTLPRGTAKADLDEIEKTTLASGATRLTIGENGRLVVAEMSDRYTTYDIELNKTDTTVFSRLAAAARPLQWIDSYMIASDREGTIRFYEFDGGNQQDIMPVIEGQAMTLSGNEKFLYGFTQTEEGVALNRARMTVR